ncbi:MAG: ADP-forming succinate--CoA ligase subunit beta [Candidatus Comchoanobacterales bacterium]
MNLHEYQAKQLLERYKITVPEGHVVATPEEATTIFQQLGTDRVVLKAQVHAGGRGKAGGVRIIDNKPELVNICKEMLGTYLVTKQTDEKGQLINHILLEAPVDIERELYLSILVDRNEQCMTVMASAEGGMDIEEVAESTPEKILKFSIDPMMGVTPFQCRAMAYKLGLKGKLVKQFTHFIINTSKLVHDNDLCLVEMNPLVVTQSQQLMCLDAKIQVDDNALYRQPMIKDLRDITQENPMESRAKQWELNYVALDGDIGCMVNGAGLAMATMDMIKFHGGKPANFLDVGGGATQERVTEAFKIITSDKNVSTILINIFGGIVRCDLIAEGIIGALADIETDIPVVVRLEGNKAEEGAQKLAESGLNIVTAIGLSSAAELAVQKAKLEEK